MPTIVRRVESYDTKGKRPGCGTVGVDVLHSGLMIGCQATSVHSSCEGRANTVAQSVTMVPYFEHRPDAKERSDENGNVDAFHGSRWAETGIVMISGRTIR